MAPIRQVPFVINVDTACTPLIQKCRDSTCAQADNYVSGTRTYVATTIPYVQYFKLYLTDPPTRCYDDVNTKWTLSNNPAGGCTQTITSSATGSRQVTVETTCITPTSYTPSLTLGVKVYTTHTCGLYETTATECAGLPNCCDTPAAYIATTNSVFTVTLSCTAKLQVCPLGDLDCAYP